MKQVIRSFAVGLFTAGIILVSVFYFSEDKSHDTTKMSDNEMIDIMKDKGYRVISEADYISLSVNAGNEQTAEKKQENVAANSTKNEAATNDKGEAEKTEKESKKDEKASDKKVENTDKEKAEKDKKAEKEKKKKKSYTLKIKSGMFPSEVADLLEKNKIIKDKHKFNKFLEDKGYAQKVQLGEFKVSSDMDHTQIAKIITKNR
ncbi:hypothetical protein ACFFIS_02680 [Virgibacillus soli]